MADSTLDLTDEDKVENTRIKELSNKVKTTAEERDTERSAKEAEILARQSAEKERDFYASFADSSSQYPQAKDFKEEIKSKVLSGYSVEDATVSVLAKNGKLTTSSVSEDTAAGGSASTRLPNNGGDKQVSEMTPEERKAAVHEMFGN